jgi:hypothetical protein
MITSETLDKLYSVFKQMQIIHFTSVQMYDVTQEYRCYCIWGKGLAFNGNCKEAHLNFPLEKLNSWHLKVWNKRIKEIPHKCEIIYFETENVVRFLVK